MKDRKLLEIECVEQMCKRNYTVSRYNPTQRAKWLRKYLKYNTLKMLYIKNKNGGLIK